MQRYGAIVCVLLGLAQSCGGSVESAGAGGGAGADGGGGASGGAGASVGAGGAGVADCACCENGAVRTCGCPQGPFAYCDALSAGVSCVRGGACPAASGAGGAAGDDAGGMGGAAAGGAPHGGGAADSVGGSGNGGSAGTSVCSPMPAAAVDGGVPFDPAAPFVPSPCQPTGMYGATVVTGGDCVAFPHGTVSETISCDQPPNMPYPFASCSPPMNVFGGGSCSVVAKAGSVCKTWSGTITFGCGYFFCSADGSACTYRVDGTYQSTEETCHLSQTLTIKR